MPSPEFRRALRELTARHGALLIFDEVMTGFRVAYGGAQSLFGIEPDLTTLGKIIGGGLPVGAYGGRAEIMDHVLPAGKVFQAGTLSGNPAGHRRRHRHLDRPSRQRPLCRGWSGFPPGWRPAWTRRPRRPASRTRIGRRRLDDDAVLQSGAGGRLGYGRPLRHAALCPLFLGHDRAGHLPAMQPV